MRMPVAGSLRGRRRRGREVRAPAPLGTSIRTSSRRPVITARPSGVNVSVRYWWAETAIRPAAHAVSIHCSIRRVDFEVCAGEIVALVGENGAGQSTLMKIPARRINENAR
jgi:ABC-type glutathione transport system ATPase component